MKIALQTLLESLNQISRQHREIFDTMVREEMGYAIYQSLIIQASDFQLPKKFGMSSDEGNEQVYSALLQFLSHPEVITAGTELLTPEERLAAFQDADVKSTDNTTFEDFFGHIDIS